MPRAGLRGGRSLDLGLDLPVALVVEVCQVIARVRGALVVAGAAGGGQRPPRTAGSAEGTSPSLLQAALQTQAWLGSTLPEWQAEPEEKQRGALPDLEVTGACWLKGDGKGLKVRCN